jgi:DNA-binding MarR family transcriptional regulator
MPPFATRPWAGDRLARGFATQLSPAHPNAPVVTCLDNYRRNVYDRGMATAARKTNCASQRTAQTGPRDKPHGFDSREQQAFLNLWRTYDRLKVLEDALFGRYDLTAQQYNALRLLRAEYPAALQTLTLGGRLISRSPDITRLLDKLDERGLIERHRPAGNRRVVQVAITRSGLALLDKLAAELRDCHRRQLGHMNTKKLQTLVALLRDARQPHEDATAPSL